MKIIKEFILSHMELSLALFVVFFASLNAVYSEVIVHSTEGEVVYTGDAVYVTGASGGGGGTVTNVWGVCSNCVHMTPEECNSVSQNVERLQSEIAYTIQSLYSKIDSFSESFSQLTNEIFRFTFTNIPGNTYNYISRFTSAGDFDSAFSPSLAYLHTITHGAPYQYVEDISGDLFRAQLDSFSRNLQNSAAYGSTNFIVHLFNGGSASDFAFPNPLSQRLYLQYASDFYNFYFGSLPQILQNFSNVSLLSEDTSYNSPSFLRVPYRINALRSDVRNIEAFNNNISNTVLKRLNCSACECEGQACTNNTGSSGCPTCEQMDIITGAMHNIVRDLNNIQFPQTNILPHIYSVLSNLTYTLPIDISSEAGEDWESIYSGLSIPLSDTWKYNPTNPLQRIELLLWSMTSLNSSNAVPSETSYEAGLTRLTEYNTNSVNQSELYLDYVQTSQTNMLTQVLNYLNPFNELFHNKQSSKVGYLIPKVDINFHNNNFTIKEILPVNEYSDYLRIFHYASLTFYYLVAGLSVYLFWIKLLPFLLRCVKYVIDILQNFFKE